MYCGAVLITLVRIDLMLNDVILWSRDLKCLKMVVLLNILKERFSCTITCLFELLF